MTEQPASEHPDVTADDVGDDAGRTTLGDVLRWLAVAACAGAAVIHFAYAPTHIEEDATHGTFFLVTAWLQLGLAFALARWRTDRRPWLAAGVVNGAVAAVWVLTRTAGLPGEDPSRSDFPTRWPRRSRWWSSWRPSPRSGRRGPGIRRSAPTRWSAAWRPWPLPPWCRRR
jgi:hypothetical protein